MKRPTTLSIKAPLIKSHPIDKSNLIFNEWLVNDFIQIICSDKNNGLRFKFALITLQGTILGKQLIATLNILTSFKKITVFIDLNNSDTGVFPENIDNASNYKGCGSTVMINFNHYSANGSNDISTQEKDCIMLFHELLHVYHNAVGDRIKIISKEEIYSQNLHEEARTVGLGSFRNDQMTENKLREEMGLPRRRNYDSVNDSDEILDFNKRYPLFPVK